jgi:hypothetical protein
MADFVQQTVTKTALRKLTTPIADVNTFNSIVQAVIDDNPWGCTAYEVSGVAQDPVIKRSEYYGGRVVFQDDFAKTVGYTSFRSPTIAGFTATRTEILANEALTAAMGGDPVNDQEYDAYSASLKCHDPSGELYYVTFTRDAVRISSYSDDALAATIETWADTIPALA